jgi:hypothetical protein
VLILDIGVADVQDHLLGIDVGDAEMAGFVNPQPGGVAGHEEGPVLRTPHRLEPGFESEGTNSCSTQTVSRK